MQIINDTQLDFSDVLIQPKRSNINSRQDVDIFRTFVWQNPFNEYDDPCHFSCIPVSAANMGTVGTLRMACELSTKGFMCCLEKHYSANEIIQLYQNLRMLADCSNLKDIDEYVKRVFVSIGVKESMDVLHEIIQAGFTDIGINIDVPNGYIPALVDRVRECRKLFPRAFTIAGTVVTGDIVQDLIMAGASCVRIGIGGGCFIGDVMVSTLDGDKPIKDVSVGEKVLTHDGSYQLVTNTFAFNDHPYVIDVNGIKCTPNHKFLVVDKDVANEITYDNIKTIGHWVEASELDEKMHMLLRLSDFSVEPIAIQKGSLIENNQNTYDLEVEKSHSYVVNGIIVHNSMCSTRLKTGVGRPQFSTIIECADFAHQLHGYVMSDGGITCTGDICKALCAGADFVMCGALFAGCDEAYGDIIEVNGKKFKKFYGMSSRYAQEKHFGGFSKYRASEGREKLIPYTGPLSDTIQDITGGIRSCCTYIGAHKLKHMPKHATFYRVNNQLNMKFANCQDF